MSKWTAKLEKGENNKREKGRIVFMEQSRQKRAINPPVVLAKYFLSFAQECQKSLKKARIKIWFYGKNVHEMQNLNILIKWMVISHRITK